MPRLDITEELLFSSVAELGELLRQGKVTSEALTKAYLDRLEKYGPKLGAVVTITRELALKQAKAADEEIAAKRWRGPLHGIPFGVKDLLATKGIPTTWGAEPYKDQVFDHDATVVRKLREAGAVLVAKLAMIELAGGFGYNHADASFTGPCRTPWNREYWSGGSSSGSGAAVAAGLVPFAIGSETSGSIMTPATYCGVNGLRPTYGRVSRHGAMALCWTLDKLGPMCRSAHDCGLVLAAIAGRDARDPTSINKPFPWPEEKGEKKRFKIGVVKNCLEEAQPEVKKNFEASLAVLRGFSEVVDDVVYPDLPLSEAVSTIVRAEGASAFRELLESGKATKLRSVSDRYGGYAGASVLAIDYLQALRLRGPAKKALDAVQAPFDALIAPTRGTVAYPLDKEFDKVYPGLKSGPPLIPGPNLVGQPALGIPNGFGMKGIPTGVMLIGRVWSEAVLLRIAAAYQEKTDWHTRRPKLDS